jgi:CubicO group peptidase (beta-lactamase class C family)
LTGNQIVLISGGMRSQAIAGVMRLIGPWLAAAPLAGSSLSAGTAEDIEALRKKHDLPALAVVVVKDGRICDRAAVGVRKYGDPARVTTNDVFHIGSCTKSMTATLAAMFIEEGKLRWNTKITEVFPELKERIHTNYQAVTLEQLLTHRAGCPGKPPAAAWKRAWEQHGTAVEQRYEFIQSVLSQPPEAPPGTRFIYSNQGYAIVGAMLEKLAGQPWEQLLTARLLRPLGMASAGFGPPGTPGRVDQPWGHTRENGKVRPSQSDNPPSIGPGGTVHCSLDDLARYTMLHLRGGRSGVRLLKPETFDKLHTPPPGADYACGWFSLARGWARGKALTHNGSNTMWYVVMWLAPERNFSVVVGTNIAGSEAENGCDEVAAAMIGKWLQE